MLYSVLITIAFVATVWAFALQIKDMIHECKTFFFVPDEEDIDYIP